MIRDLYNELDTWINCLFFYIYLQGQGDLCRCFACDGGLYDWSSGDDPIKEHATYFPKCLYMIKLKGAAYVEMQQRNRERNENELMVFIYFDINRFGCLR
jgi:hypothetical protein